MKKIPHIWQIVVSCEDLGGIFAARRQLLLNYRSWNSGWRTLWCGRRKIIIIHHKDVSITKITPSRNYNGFLPLCLCKNDIIQLDKQARGVEKSWVSSVNYDSTVSPKIRRSVIQEKVALSNFTIGQEKKTVTDWPWCIFLLMTSLSGTSITFGEKSIGIVVHIPWNYLRLFGPFVKITF